MSTTQTSELPNPTDDPTIKYAHEGKQYTVFASDRTFTIDEFRPADGPTEDGIVIIKSDDGEHILSEYRHSKGGASRKALGEFEPEEPTRAVWTVEGLMAQLRSFDIGEVDPSSYDDLYWSNC